MAGIDAPGVEVFMPHRRTVKYDALFVFLAAAAFLFSGIVTALPLPSTQQGHLIPAQPSRAGASGFSFKILSSTEGIDLKPYTVTLGTSIMRIFHPKLPKKAAAREKETAVVRVRIQKDGSLADKFVTIESSSGEKEFDAAALSAIRAAAPFGRLPEGYSGDHSDLLIGFYRRNNPPLEPQPKLVPIVTALNQ
jgi:TonB family protein